VADFRKKFPGPEWVEIESDRSENKMRIALDYPSVGQLKALSRSVIANDAVVDTVRYVVKNWENVTVDGEPCPCKLKQTPMGSELEDDSLFVILALNFQWDIFALYHKHISFTETDKKKS